MTNADPRKPWNLLRLLGPIVCLSLAGCAGQNDLTEPESDLVTITVIGTNDVHGQLAEGNFRGGLTTLSGYVQNLRDARASDGGAVLVIDAGDMWQGTLESNLNEGAAIVQAYNALGYTAATIGNHEFDFGPVGERSIPGDDDDDPRGVLKARTSEANFPMLAANIVVAATGEYPEWPNVSPSVLLNVEGIDVGIIGIITENALATTISGNVFDLEILPLADTIEKEATQLRHEGADLVIVTAHAGTRCSEHDDPLDISSCNLRGEIVQVANALPIGLVDHIVAGHVHEGVSHEFNGIAVTSSYAVTAAFGRVDFVIDRASGDVIERTIYPPQLNCPRIREATGDCIWLSPGDGPTIAANYAGKPIQPMPSVVAVATAAIEAAARSKNESLNVTLTETFTTEGNPESALANLFLTALLEESDVDVVVHNVSGGIRSALPAGELTFGTVYQMFPFDNRITLHEFSGAQLRKIFAAQATNGQRRAGFAGVYAAIDCVNDEVTVELTRLDGSEILDDDSLTVLANDFLATAGDGILFPVTPPGGGDFTEDPRLTRDALVSWFLKQGDTLSPDDFLGRELQEWRMPEREEPGCRLPPG